MKLNVPYYSQYLDFEDLYWQPRGCGIVCAKMVLDFFGKETPALVEMAEEGKAARGYHDDYGWAHDYTVHLFKEHGLEVYRKEGMEGLDEIHAALSGGNPVIVSIVKRILEQTKFHQIVLVGFTQDGAGSIKTLLYHDPENTSREKGSFREVDVDIFMKGWRKMAIFTTPK